MKPKKILLLDGSFFQIPSIETVKRLGHYIITCNNLPDNLTPPQPEFGLQDQFFC